MLHWLVTTDQETRVNIVRACLIPDRPISHPSSHSAALHRWNRNAPLAISYKTVPLPVKPSIIPNTNDVRASPAPFLSQLAIGILYR